MNPEILKEIPKSRTKSQIPKKSLPRPAIAYLDQHTDTVIGDLQKIMEYRDESKPTMSVSARNKSSRCVNPLLLRSLSFVSENPHSFVHVKYDIDSNIRIFNVLWHFKVKIFFKSNLYQKLFSPVLLFSNLYLTICLFCLARKYGNLKILLLGRFTEYTSLKSSICF